MKHRIAAMLTMILAVPACGPASTAIDAAEEATTDAPDDAGLEGVEEEPGVVCELGTIYPEAAVIDPDAPVYSDSSWSQEEVEAAFIEAALTNSAYYRGYLAAHKYPEVLECAFCACGCAGMSISHLSAVDCFKDMHGFT